MADIKAIETSYRGYRFRSRLEARWAVFFEALGLRWEYEVEGFENEQGDRYLPDFRIWMNRGRSAYWVEVKGDPNWLFENRHEIDRIHDWGGILPGFHGSGENDDVDGGLIILGSIPEPTWGPLFLPVLGHSKGVNLYRRLLDDDWGNTSLFRETALLSYFSDLPDIVYNISVGSQRELSIEPLTFRTPNASAKIVKALTSARSARFEHGESPR